MHNRGFEPVHEVKNKNYLKLNIKITISDLKIKRNYKSIARKPESFTNRTIIAFTGQMKEYENDEKGVIAN